MRPPLRRLLSCVEHPTFVYGSLRYPSRLFYELKSTGRERGREVMVVAANALIHAGHVREVDCISQTAPPRLVFTAARAQINAAVGLFSNPFFLRCCVPHLLLIFSRNVCCASSGRGSSLLATMIPPESSSGASAKACRSLRPSARYRRK